MEDDMRHDPATAQRHPQPTHVEVARRAGDTGAALPRLVGVIVAVLAVPLVVFLVFTQLAQLTVDDVAVAEVREGSITTEVYEAVDLGTPKEEVLTALRPALPVDTRAVEEFEGRLPETVAAECVYYERSGGRAGETFRFCFNEDVLVDKTLLLAGDPGADSPLVEEGEL
jgi:hypothetical protein